MLASGSESLVGHTWFVLNAPDGAKSYGFAPAIHGDPLGPGTVYTTDDENYTETSYSRSIALSEAQYSAINKFATECVNSDAFGDYDGIRNSCIDFVYTALRQVGMEAPPFINEGVVWPTWNTVLYDAILDNQSPMDPSALPDYTCSGGDISEGLHGRSTNDSLFGGFSGDWISGFDGNDLLRGGVGNDTLRGGSDNDILDGGVGYDHLYGGEGNDWLGYTASGFGNESQEEIHAAGNTYDGGTGADVLAGSVLHDTYIFRSGDGYDFVTTYGGGDELRLEPYRDLGNGGLSLEIPESAVSFSRDGLDVIVHVGANGDQVRIFRWFDKGEPTIDWRLGTVTLGSKTWTRAEIEASIQRKVGTEGDDVLTGDAGFSNSIQGLGGRDRLTAGGVGDLLDGGAGDDTLTGGAGVDTLQGGANNDTLNGRLNTDGSGDLFEGGAGNDVLYGTTGADTYHFALGDGMDTIVESANNTAIDRVVFTGIAFDDVVVSRSGTTLVITHNNSTDRLYVSGWYTTAGATANQIEEVQFSDRTLSAAELTAMGLVVQGRDDNTTTETLTGLGGFKNEIHGKGGADRLSAGNLGDLLDGGVGNDTLYGGAGKDTLQGGADNDLLQGAVNSDGSGDVFEGGTGTDQLVGTSGADRYVINAGDGMDYIRDIYAGSAQDVLELNVGGNITVSRSGTALILKNEAGEGATIWDWYTYPGTTSNQIEQVTGTLAASAAELTAMGLVVQGNDTNTTTEELYGLTGFKNEIHGNGGVDRLQAGNLGDLLDGGVGNDTLNGGSGNDILAGGTGNDAINGGAGNDTFRYSLWDGLDILTDSAGTGDTLDMSAIPGDYLHFWKQNADLFIQVGDGTDGVIVKNQFGTGTTQVDIILVGGGALSAAQVAGMAEDWPA